MKKYISLLAAFAVLFSCVEKEPEQNMNNDEAPVENIVSIFANAPAPHSEAGEDESSSSQPQQSQATRTQLVDGSKVMWSPGDVVKVCFEPLRGSGHNSSSRYGYSTTFSNSGTDLSESAVFSGNWQPHSKTNLISSYGVAVYPGNSSNFSFSSDATTKDWTYPTTTITYKIPTEQEAIEGTFAKDLNLSYAIVNYSDVANNTAKVKFKNLCSVFCVTLPSTEYNIKSIKIQINSNSTNSSDRYFMTGIKKFILSSSSLAPYDRNACYSGTEPDYVILRKSDGSNLVPGATYYAVVWGEGHNYRGIKITFTNNFGDECTKVLETFGTSSWLQVAPGKKYTFTVKSALDFGSAPRLELNGDSDVVILAKGGTSNLGVIANNAWSVDTSNLPSWLTVNKDASMLYFTAVQNPEPTSRSVSLTISSADLTKEITVTQPPVYYKISGSVVSKASDLENGAMYAIFFAGGTDNKYEQPYLWQTDIYGDVSKKSFSNKSDNLTNNQVFKFHKTSTLNGSWKSDGQSYNSASSGYLQSMYNNKYLVGTAIGNAILDFAAESTSQAVDLRLGNQWSTDQVYGPDIDVWITTNQTIYWTGSYLWYGGTGNTPRKWFFYKVVEN